MVGCMDGGQAGNRKEGMKGGVVIVYLNHHYISNEKHSARTPAHGN